MKLHSLGAAKRAVLVLGQELAAGLQHHDMNGDDMRRKFRLGDMTFEEFSERLKEQPLILVPLGSVEEQGTMAPMGDWILTERLADMIAERTDTIAAPTMPFGFGEYFRKVPGGIQLRADTLRNVLRDILCNFLDHDISRLVILNGHTGNSPVIQEVTHILRQERGIVIPSINLWRITSKSTYQQAFGEQGGSSSGHGAQPISAVCQYFFPDLMRLDRIEPPATGKKVFGFPTAGMGAIRFKDMDVAVPLSVTDITDNGVTGGDPAATSADAGRILAENIVAKVSEFVAAWRAVDPQIAPNP